MAYLIKPTDKSTLGKILTKLSQKLEKSRFKAKLTEDGKSVKLSKIRLKTSKDYCGNHAGPCQIKGVHRDKKANFLEGSDWVAFNDGINDLLDKLKVEANVTSSICVMRKGLLRRVEYSGVDGGEFDKEGEEYLNNIGGKAIKSYCQSCTPGIQSWK